MKHLNLLLLIFLLASTAFAESVEYRKKNVSTILCGTFLDVTTAERISVSAGTVTCSYAFSTDVANEASWTSLPSAAAVGTLGQFCVPVTNTMLNIDGRLRVYCDSSVAGAASYEQKLTTIRSDVATIADGAIGSLTQTFDGQTLAEGTNTLDLEASEISADGQFVGDKISLYTSTGSYYGSSCITVSTNANERVTTKENLASFHTVGDYYVIRPDAGCTVVANLLTAPNNQPSVVPTAGSETFGEQIRLMFQRLVYKLNDDRNTNRRNWYKADGATVLGHQNLNNSGNINSTGALVP